MVLLQQIVREDSIDKVQTVRVPPKNGSSFSQGNKVEFELDMPGFTDLSQILLKFKAVVAGGTNPALSYNAKCAFSQLDIQCQGVKLLEITKYNWQNIAFEYMKDHANHEARWGAVEGKLSQSDRQSAASGRLYHILPFKNYFRKGVFFPLSEYPLRVTFHIETDAIACENSTGTGAAGTYSEFELIVESHIPSKAAHYELMNSISQGVYFPVIDFNHYSDTLSGTSNTVIIDEKGQNLRGLYSFFHANNAASNAPNQLNTYTSGNVTSYNLRIYNTNYYDRDVEHEAPYGDTYHQMLKYAHSDIEWETVDSIITQATYASGKQVIAVSLLRGHKEKMRDMSGILYGRRTSDDRSDMKLVFTSSSGPSNTDCEVFTELERHWFMEGRKIRLIQ